MRFVLPVVAACNRNAAQQSLYVGICYVLYLVNMFRLKGYWHMTAHADKKCLLCM